MQYDIVIHGGLVVYPERIVRADVGIQGSVIKTISSDASLKGKSELDADGCYVLPGLIDPHTHPVYLDDLGGLARTAACGGVSTVIHYAYAKPGE